MVVVVVVLVLLLTRCQLSTACEAHCETQCTDEKTYVAAAVAAVVVVVVAAELLEKKKSDQSGTKGTLIPGTLYSQARRIVNTRWLNQRQ